MDYAGWLKAWFGYAVGFVAAVFLLVVGLEHYTDMPLRFTKSVSYDVKIKFAREQLAEKSFDTFIVGSSMALNNIDSAVLESSHVSQHVLNLSSWGLAASEVLQFLQMVDLSDVRRVIYSSQYFDYQGEVDKVLDERELARYMKGQWVLKTYFQNIARLPESFMRYFEEDHQGTQRYLKFDEHGDVNFVREGFKINKHKWEEIPPFPKTPLDDSYFKHLLALNDYLKDRGIELVVITNPFRQELIESDEEFQSFFHTHTDYLKRLSKVQRFVYINAHAELNFDDTYFVDAYHLDETGAQRLTQLVADRLELVRFSRVQDL